MYINTFTQWERGFNFLTIRQCCHQGVIQAFTVEPEQCQDDHEAEVQVPSDPPRPREKVLEEALPDPELGDLRHPEGGSHEDLHDCGLATSICRKGKTFLYESRSEFHIFVALGLFCCICC